VRALVIGSGAREHALAWKLLQGGEVDELYAAPGNPGLAAFANCVPIPADATVELAEFAASLRIDLTVVGPELPLVQGIGDEFAQRGLVLLGPSRAAAEIEGSKVFTKEFCLRHGVPTAAARVVRNRDEAARAVRELGIPVVFKADGLAAGKGVTVCHSRDEVDQALVRFFEERAFGAAGERVLVEECLVGDEVTFMVLTDGGTIVPLASSRDFKRLLDGDGGPNTGGMGAFSPALLPTELAALILRQIIQPTLEGLAREGREYRGVLYAGVMLTADGPKLLEYNCRLGDPETQVVLPRLDAELYTLCRAAAVGELSGARVAWKREVTACVVLAAAGYPEAPRRGDAISGLAEALALPGVLVFHAGTAVHDGRLVTAGGRVLSVVGRAGTLAEAVACAYRAVEQIHYDGMQLRHDIGRVRK
jgi:phosphoribosylamine---glycine ligase